jgi:hypothetical protein
MRRGRDRETERVEMIGGDPDVFGTQRTATSPTRRPRMDLLALGGVVLVVIAVAVAVAWPRSSGPSRQTSKTSPSTTLTRTSVPVPSTIPGRQAPLPTSNAGFVLTVEPSAATPGAPVMMQLEGDLSGVSSPIAAVAWLDRQVAGAWRTVHWIARTSDTAQVVGDVSNDLLGPGPDAATFAADQPVRFDVFPLVAGDYRLCRYVPLRSGATTTVPTTNPVYLCAPLVVNDAFTSASATMP